MSGEKRRGVQGARYFVLRTLHSAQLQYRVRSTEYKVLAAGPHTDPEPPYLS